MIMKTVWKKADIAFYLSCLFINKDIILTVNRDKNLFYNRHTNAENFFKVLL